MFLRGINYDVGTPFRKDHLSRPEFDEALVRREIGIIKEDLHCDAIRISGYDIYRLSTAAGIALELGLQVWLSPACIDAATDEAMNYLVRCADEAEKLRVRYPDVIFVIGCEYSLFLKGFVKGETIYDRMKTMFSPVGIALNLLGLRQNVYRRLNFFLKNTTARVRKHFNGKLTYASGTWEKIDWDMFDMVGIDHYRASYNKSTYVKELRKYYAFHKPVAVLEFGCCTYKGAEDKGGAGWAITEVQDGRQVIKGNFIRDEHTQANYITELLDIFKQEDLYAVFVFTFVNPVYRYDENPGFDLDMASYGIVKPVSSPEEGSYKGLPWVTKESFHQLSAYYKEYGVGV